MIGLPAGMRVYLACGVTDMRKGFDGLSVMAQDTLKESPFSGALFCFRGRRGDLVKILYWDGQGFCLFAKRLEKGKFTWPTTKEGSVTLTPAHLSMLVEGISNYRTARLNGIEPEAWLTDVIARIGSHPINRLAELLPWNWLPPATQSVAA